MMAANVRQVFASSHGVVEVHRPAAGHEKNMAHAVTDKELGDIISEADH
jgi:hypothetical protein